MSMTYRPIKTEPLDRKLGRFIPDDFKHVARWKFAPSITVTSVNRTLPLPAWHWSHNQGSEGACVGFGSSMLMAIMNMAQRRAAGTKPYTVRYDPWWLWDRAKERDPWPETNPGDGEGTSVSAAMDVLRTLGHIREPKTTTQERTSGTPDLAEGISANRWATTVDDMRSGIALGNPISIGVNWYANFDQPVKMTNGEHWIGRDALGAVRGGHCVCIYGASDRRQAFRMKNSWGRNYPLAWMPYETMQRLLNEYGEATLVSDK